MLPSDISGQGFPYSPRFGGGYGRERTAMLPSDISGQGFPYSPRFCGGYGRERTAVSCPAVPDKASPIPTFRRHLKRRSRARLMPNGNASVRYFRTRLPLFPALRRWVWERTNSNASVRHFRTRLPLFPALLRRVRERTNGSFLSGGSGQGFPYSAFGGGYGRERTAMSLFGGSGRGLN